MLTRENKLLIIYSKNTSRIVNSRELVDNGFCGRNWVSARVFVLVKE